MTIGSQPDFEILPAPPAQRADALELVLGQMAGDNSAEHIALLLAEAEQGRVDLTGLLIARRDEQVLGAVWAQPQPGRVASIWPPAVRPSQGAADADRLLVAALEHLAPSSVRLAQTLLTTDDSSQAGRLLRHGFMHLAELLYMVCLSDRFPVEQPAGPYEFVAADEGDPLRLADIIVRTYEGTLDCPALNGVREVEDVLEGYKACGVFAPALWLIVRRDERDVGCLLLAARPELPQCEIVYAGLVPEERGRGGGRTLACQALWLAAQSRQQRVVVAVDAANAPAANMYSAVGFVVWDKRSAFIRMFPPNCPKAR